MMNNFVWADLSTFNLEQTKGFYTSIFNWSYEEQDGYHFAEIGGNLTAGIYQMPEKFQEINMPSFWMSYIQVEDIEKTVQKANGLGAKIEIAPTEFGEDAYIALARDPSGAGFTLYQGANLSKLSGIGAPVWNELFVSDASLVKSFYAELFGWNFAQSGDHRFEISLNGKPIAAISEIPNSIKGQHQFWGIYFRVEDIEATTDKIIQSGGEVETFDDLSEHLLMAFDPNKAVFFVTS